MSTIFPQTSHIRFVYCSINKIKIIIMFYFQVIYDCQEQKPVNITAKTKDISHNTNYNYHSIERVNDTKVSDNGNDIINGIYIADSLPSNSHCLGQLIVNILTGDKGSSQEFEFCKFSSYNYY